MTRPTLLSASAAVGGLDQVGGGEVADPVPGVHRGDPECDEEVAFPGAGRPDQAGVLLRGDPFQAGEVVQGRGRDAGHGAVELVEGFDYRERGGLEAGAGVGGVPAGDLGLDQRAQQLFGCPPLGLRGAQQFRREDASRATQPNPGNRERRGGRNAAYTLTAYLA